MSDAARSYTLSSDLRVLAEWRRAVTLGAFETTKEGEAAFLRSLDMLVVECESLEQQLAVARRWGPGALDFRTGFARDKAILEGVRAGRIVDLVPVLEREMARDAALNQGGAA